MTTRTPASPERDRPDRATLRALAPLVVALAACSGSLDGDWGSEPDGGMTGDTLGMAAGESPCGEAGCPPGQECDGEGCVAIDPCRTVVCTTQGEVCSGGTCLAGEADDDGDGVRARDDCDDTDETVNPGATETCDGLDEDCDRAVDEDYDLDGDGSSQCGGGAPEWIDCDDSDPDVHPGAAEVCNGIDDDCDWDVDEDAIDAGGPCGGEVGVCSPGVLTCEEGVLTCEGGVGPTPEVCDGLDNDCDGSVDEDLPPRPCTGACGTGTERCVAGAWVCDAPMTGECEPGSYEDRRCSCGTSRRVCSPTCTWGAFGICTGAPCGAGYTCCYTPYGDGTESALCRAGTTCGG